MTQITRQGRCARRRKPQDIASFELVPRRRRAPARLQRRLAHRRARARRPDAPVLAVQRRRRSSHRYRIAVLRDPQLARRLGRPCTTRCTKATRSRISEPRNHFPLVHAQRTLLFAGGIGVTPLLCMAQRLAAIGADFELHYCTRSRRAHRLPRRDRRLAVRAARAVPLRRRRRGAEAGPAGGAGRSRERRHAPLRLRPDRLHRLRGEDRRRRLGWPTEQVHLEYFGAAPQDTAGDRPFEVKIASSGAGVRRARGPDGGAGAAGARHRDPDLLRAGRVRHLHHARAGRRMRPPRPVLHRRGEGEERPVHALLLAGEDARCWCWTCETPLASPRLRRRGIQCCRCPGSQPPRDTTKLRYITSGDDNHDATPRPLRPRRQLPAPASTCWKRASRRPRARSRPSSCARSKTRPSPRS